MVPLAVVPQPSAAAAAAAAVELVWFHCLLHEAPQYDPLELAE
jgi:hypothetical protein